MASDESFDEEVFFSYANDDLQHVVNSPADSGKSTEYRALWLTTRLN